ncbi:MULTISPECIES: ATP-dependent DNA ligase [Microbacterium]|uniref:ATP-dependent DNA ligase n=1 Tax=Microbacterium wangchenii TaxID=2541726 RepID=A0ABX5SQG4_9MICO|nr:MULTISPECIES: ATP-dependent DNA ligase [Microbacterium]MCK6068220.1 ATP-dependent DNA ligase [Microbacterium sp. EYE_512]QBR87507.1 ATP-dependent DNA ligase [Microbacterium wangchenii]TXK15776.1 ATP-dependent DNA ligase [Microbacterium wangchenii]
MGQFIYDNTAKIELEDRLLAHLQVVIGTKLRRRECFFFTWKEDTSVGGGRRSVWLNPHTPMQFKYHGSRTPQINPAWLDALAYTANQQTGLYIIREPEGVSAAALGSQSADLA